MLAKLRYLTALTAALAIAGASCTTDHDRLLARSYAEAGSNEAQIRSMVESYEGSDRHMAELMAIAMIGQGTLTGPGMDSIEAIYTIAAGNRDLTPEEVEAGRKFTAMPMQRTSDLTTLTADRLRGHIDDTRRLRACRKWNTELTDEQAAELLMPYRMGNEPVSDWRGPYRQWLAPTEDSIATLDNAVDAARIVSAFIGACPYSDRLQTPHRSALRLLEAPIGFCREDCDRTAYAMRAMGIPVGVDMMPVSPDNGGSHRWNVVYDNHDRIYRMFDNLRFPPTRDSLHYDMRRKGKVYRMTFGPQLERLEKYAGVHDAPPLLLHPRLKDVTAEYFGHNRAEVEVSGDGNVYLGIFTGHAFAPVDIARRSGGRAVFTDIEPEVIFFPVRSASGRYEQCGWPFMLTADGRVHLFEPRTEEPQSVSLTRKFPRRFHLVERMSTLIGCRIQAAPTAAGPWRDIHRIEQTPAHSYCRIPIDKPLRERYIRIVKYTPGNAMIASLTASRDSVGADPIPASIAGRAAADDRYSNIVDSDILSWAPLSPDCGDMIVRFDSDSDIANLFLVAHNDDNFVLPGQEYELIYFTDRGVKSLGRKVSDGFSIGFTAPTNAVMVLRNLTKGREEQVFVWSADGRQLFNIDLRGQTR